ncbi:hypothetical protein PR002_g25628 [Phytophthora rubi]|uniref:Peptidase A2 domain-containing protein n=1 Tax=Phytophthora rubi TaxID=129364 RepID=A0A6A3I320_9STRA|nr:hypothetical protein PR002_g25628 [Phytophthora rubi]
MMETDAASQNAVMAIGKGVATINATDVKTVVDVAAKIAKAESPWQMPALKTSGPPSMNVAPVTKSTSTIPLATEATGMPQLSRRPTQALITSTLEQQPSRNVRRTGEARAVLARTRLRDPLDDLSLGDILPVVMSPANVGGTARAALVVRMATMPTSAGGDASSASKCTTQEVVSSSNDSRNLPSGSPTVTGLGISGPPQSAQPTAIEANYVFAFVGEAKRPGEESEGEEDDMRSGEENEERKSTPAESSEDAAGGKGEACDATAESAEDSAQAITGAVMTRRSAVTIGESKKLKLLPGERLGWWSSRKFDRRIQMRALVMGAVNNERTKILLDTGANVSAVTESFARKLRLKRLASADLKIDVQGIGKTKVETTIRAMVKVTLGWEIVYEFEVWIMDHHAGVDFILGTDFMIPAGIRLDLYNSKAKLPDEIEINLIKSASAREDTEYGNTICGGPTETVDVASRLTAEFKLQRRPPDATTHELWVRRVNQLVPTVRFTHNGRPSRVLLTNTGGKPGSCPAHFPVVQWVPHEVLPLTEGYVRVDSTKYRDWQLSIDPTMTPTGIRHRPETADGAHQRGLSCAEQWERLERLQAETEQLQHNQPSSMAFRDESELEAESDEREPGDLEPQANDWVCLSADPGAPSLGNGCPITTPDRGDGWDPGIAGSLDTNQPEGNDEADQEPADLSLRQATQRIAEVEDLLSEARASCKEAEVRSAAAANAVTSPAEWGLRCIDDDLLDEDPAEHLRLRFLAALTDLVREEGYQITAVDDRGDTPSTEFGDEDNETRRRSGWEHTPTRIQLDDFAHELAFLPDLTTAESTVLDYEGDNVRSSNHSTEQYNKLVKVLRRHAKIMISSGNALPPPAYGVVCDIDVQGHAPIKQRARRVPLKHLEKLYELLKGLLKGVLEQPLGVAYCDRAQAKWHRHSIMHRLQDGQRDYGSVGIRDAPGG